MSVEAEKKAPKTDTRTRAEKLKDIPQQDILELLKDEDLSKMKNKYGTGVESFVKGIRSSDEYGHKCKTMTDYEVLEFGKAEPRLGQYHKQHIDRTPKDMENYDTEGSIISNKHGSFSQKEYTKIRKEKGQEAASKYAQQRKREKKPDNKEKEEKKSDEKKEVKEEKKAESTPKEDTKKVDKPAEVSKPVEDKKELTKEPEKKPDDKPATKKAEDPPKEKKKHFRSNRFKKKEKKSDDKKAGFFSKLGTGIKDTTKFIGHQTWNAASYLPRTVLGTLKFAWQYMDRGFSKVGREKIQGPYLSKFKWDRWKK